MSPPRKKGIAKKAARKSATSRSTAKKSTAKKRVPRPASEATSNGPGSQSGVPLPFERFAIEFIESCGGAVELLGPQDYRVRFDPGLAKKFRRKSTRLIFDPERAILPKGSQFAAPGSRFGLALIAAARGSGQISRAHRPIEPTAKAKQIASKGFVLHDVKSKNPRFDELRWVTQLIWHMTLTLKGGVADQDLRSIVADPRGPVFEFLEYEERKGWELRPGFPDEPVYWGEHDLSDGVPREDANQLWSELQQWLNRVQDTRLERWRKNCEEQRDRDLERINTYYETRLKEEEERRRRKREEPDDMDAGSEAQIKLEWNRRVRSVRERWRPQAEILLWGIEEIARPRVPVQWDLETPDGPGTLEAEIDMADGAMVRQPCPICGRLAGEFWWSGVLVCRRCRGRSPRSRAPVRGGEPAVAAF